MTLVLSWHHLLWARLIWLGWHVLVVDIVLFIAITLCMPSHLHSFMCCVNSVPGIWSVQLVHISLLRELYIGPVNLLPYITLTSTVVENDCLLSFAFYRTIILTIYNVILLLPYVIKICSIVYQGLSQTWLVGHAALKDVILSSAHNDFLGPAKIYL